MIARFSSISPDATLELGRNIGRHAMPGLTIGLEGELGAGKTLLTRGLYEGLGLVEREWSGSPTFVLACRYLGPPVLLHADCYRLTSAEEARDLGLVDAASEGAIVVVEWSDRFPEVLPEEHLRIRFEWRDELRRELLLHASGASADQVLAQVLPP
jgi:tRNA threonylcarbamoyladenosine biosynthesis protein TsaE